MNEEKEVMSLYLTKEIKEQLKKAAKEKDMSINAIIRTAIKEFLKKG